MKNIAKILIIMITFLGIHTITSAASTENLLYKNIAMSNMEVKNIYGERKGRALIDALDHFFIDMRAEKNKIRLRNIEKRAIPVIERLEKKTRLTKTERVIKVLAKNIYFRSKVLEEYLID